MFIRQNSTQHVQEKLKYIVLIVRRSFFGYKGNLCQKDHPWENWTIYHAMLSTHYSVKISSACDQSLLLSGVTNN